MQRRRLARAVTKAVVFDLGGVLIDLHSDKARRELIEKYGMRPQRFDHLTRSCFTSRQSSITELAIVGRVGTADYLKAFVRECTREDVEGIRANRLSVIGGERADVFEVARKLQRAGLTCCVFSNTIALHWEKLRSRSEYPSLRGFNRIFASHLIALRQASRKCVFFRGRRSEDTHVGMPSHRRHAAECGQSCVRRMARFALQ